MPQTSADYPTRYWHRIDEQRVQCDLCPRECKLKEGQQGLCFVRACRGGEVVLTTYGRSQWLLYRPDRKETAEPFSARHPGTLLRNGRL